MFKLLDNTIFLIAFLAASFMPFASLQAEETIKPTIGFRSFQDESEAARQKLSCPNSVLRDTTPPQYDGDGNLYGCILGEMETVKWFVNEKPNTGRVDSVKFLWNDWFINRGQGVHTDKNQALKAVKVVASLYAPKKEKEIITAFHGKASKTFVTDKFELKYTFVHGPAINERMFVITEIKK